jgi:hypothetical protein
MNKKQIILFMIFCLSCLPLTAATIRRKKGRWYLYNEKTHRWEQLFPSRGIADPRYRERMYPDNENSKTTSFGLDRTYVDQTNRNMGNNE